MSVADFATRLSGLILTRQWVWCSCNDFHCDCT